MNRFALFCVLLLLALGCATHRELESYKYSPPVVIGCTGVDANSKDYIVSFAFTNVSTWPVWFDGWYTNRPVYTIQWKGHHYGMSESPENEDFTGAFELPPGQSCSFELLIQRSTNSLPPFRVGVWIFTDLTGTVPIQPYWSDYVSR